MVTLVLVIGALNFALGFGLAVLLESPLQFSLPRIGRSVQWRRTPRPKRPTASPQPASAAPPAPPPAPTAPENCVWLTPAWRAILDAKQVTIQSFAEAALWVADTKYNECADLVRQLEQNAETATSELLLTDLLTLVPECRNQLADLKAQVDACKQPGIHTAQMLQLVQWLEQAVQSFEPLKQSCDLATTTSKKLDPSQVRQQLLHAFAQLRQWSEKCCDTLARLIVSEARLPQLAPSVFVDQDTTALNRLGLETAIQEWLEKDPERVRMASAVLVDVDQCGHLNDRCGITRTNDTLTAAIKLVLDLLRKDRGFDRVVRLNGQSILMFLGDTAMRNAVLAAERVRQHLAMTTFKSKDANISLTSSFAATEWSASETFDELLERLRLGIKEAKEAGRNCTFSCGFDDMRMVQPSRMQISAREVAIGR